MPLSKQLNKLITSRRWVSFLESVGTGLQINLTLITEGELLLDIPDKCPSCNHDYYKLSPGDIAVAWGYYKNPGQFREFTTGNNDSAVIISSGENYCIVARECFCISERGLLKIQHRTGIAERLIHSFQTSFMDGFTGGQSTVELSALRQMNQIILSLFREENNASVRAFDLILSALVIMLGAQASWLEYSDGLQSNLIIKGDKKAVETYFQSKFSVNLQVSEIDIHSKYTEGRLGVLLPEETERTKTLLPLLAQECIIVFEIESLFRLLREQLSRILSAFNNVLILIDEHYNIAYFNNSARKLFGDGIINLIGYPAMELSAPWTGHLKTGPAQPVCGYKSVFDQETETRFLDWQILPLKDNLTVGGWLVIADDRTDYYHWQEVGRQAESFTNIASVIGPLAHELRNPMAAAKGLLQMARRKKEPEKISGYIELVLREIDRMSLLVNDFLQLGRTVNMNFELVDLVSFITELMPLLEGEASGTDVEIVQDFASVPDISCDQSQLTQVLLNLVRNGIEAAGPKGKVAIILRNEGEWVDLGIKDSGTGIRLDIMDKLFQPFFSTKERGTGLGLAVIKAIIHNHGGQIVVTNPPEGGALFLVKLPVLSHKVSETRKVDIIINLSDEWIRYPVEQVLLASGFSTRIVTKMAEITESGRKFLPRVILLDPDTTINEIENLRQTWPGVKVIMIGEPLHVTEGGDCLFIPKPLNYARLVEEIRQEVEA